MVISVSLFGLVFLLLLDKMGLMVLADCFLSNILCFMFSKFSFIVCNNRMTGPYMADMLCNLSSLTISWLIEKGEHSCCIPFQRGLHETPRADSPELSKNPRLRRASHQLQFTGSYLCSAIGMAFISSDQAEAAC